MGLDKAPRSTGSVLDAFRLDGQVVIVTGASSGLGVAFAQTVAQAGANLVLGARRVDRLSETEALVRAEGREALAVSTDVTDPGACQALVDAAVRRFGRVNVLVNNAGTADAVPALRQTPEDFRRVVDINLHGSYWMAQACARVMERGSSIVNISSVLGLTAGEAPSAAYASSKAAIVGLTRDLASQWSSRQGIRVNALAPGFVLTELTQPLVDNPPLLERILARTPMGRLGEPSEICTALLFLASPASSFTTGVTLPVDGGWTMP